MSLTGSCLCGALRYESSADPVFAGNCYCGDCRKESGNEIERTFCPKCGSTVFSRPRAYAGMTLLRVGTLDDSSKINPGRNIYISRAQPWDAPSPNIPGFPETPSRS